MGKQYDWFRRSRRGVVVSLRPEEAALLTALIGELQEELAGPADSPVMARLFPRAYLDPTEERRETEFAAFVHADLLRARLDRLGVLLDVLDPIRRGRREVDVVLDDEAVALWMGVLNDARLALGTAIGVTDDLEPDDLEPDDPRLRPLQVYSLLTWFFAELVDVVAADLPEGED